LTDIHGETATDTRATTTVAKEAVTAMRSVDR